jgi:putative AlgH/UPF0301 family transcriptional regulator
MKIVSKKNESERKFKFLVGTAKWTEDEIENQIKNDEWTISEGDASIFFDPNKLINKRKQDTWNFQPNK